VHLGRWIGKIDELCKGKEGLRAPSVDPSSLSFLLPLLRCGPLR
jgi:hypothetical protein